MKTLINLIHLDLFYSLISFFLSLFSSPLRSAAFLLEPNGAILTILFLSLVASSRIRHAFIWWIIAQNLSFIRLMPYGACQMSSNSILPFSHLVEYTHSHTSSPRTVVLIFTNKSRSRSKTVMHRYRYFASNNRYRFVILRSLRTKSINWLCYISIMGLAIRQR